MKCNQNLHVFHKYAYHEHNHFKRKWNIYLCDIDIVLSQEIESNTEYTQLNYANN